MSVKQKIKSFSLFIALGLNLLLLVILGFNAHTRAGDIEPSETPKLCLAALTIRQPQPAPQVIREEVKQSEPKPQKVVKKRPVPPKKITKVVEPKPVKKEALPPKPVMTQVEEPIIEVQEELVEIQKIASPPLPDPRILAEQVAQAQQAQMKREALVAELIKRLEQEKRFPALAKRLGLSGTVTLLISVDPNGHISHFELVQGNTCHKVLCKSAMNTAHRVAKKPLTMAGPDKSLRVKVPIVYELI